jgi:hypothetical protein
MYYNLLKTDKLYLSDSLDTIKNEVNALGVDCSVEATYLNETGGYEYTYSTVTETYNATSNSTDSVTSYHTETLTSATNSSGIEYIFTFNKYRKDQSLPFIIKRLTGGAITEVTRTQEGTQPAAGNVTISMGAASVSYNISHGGNVLKDLLV